MSGGSEAMHEHELRAFLTEDQHDSAAHQLAEIGDDLGQDDKASYFFVLSGLNLSVVKTDRDARIKLKGGVVGSDTSPVEYPEVVLADAESAERAVQLLSALTGVTPQQSYQVRHNYRVGLVEVALKYTEAWGFHAELERLYSGNTEAELNRAAKEADEDIYRLADRLGIKLATDGEIQSFRRQYDATGKGRGEYTTDELLTRYNSLYKLAALRRLPERQVLDQLSIEWISEHRPDDLPRSGDVIQLSISEKTLLQNMDIPQTWFVSSDRKGTIHGQLHLARVAAIASHVARAEGANDIEARTSFIAGLLHDIRRKDDKGDPGHAKAAANWVSENWEEICDFLGDVAEGVNSDDVHQAVIGHEDSTSIKNARCRRIAEYLRTADALDRYRLPKLNWWVDNRRLKVVPSASLKARVFDAVVASEREYAHTAQLAVATRLILVQTSQR